MRSVFAIALACLTGGCLPAFRTVLTDIGPTTARNVSIHSSPADLRSIVVVRSASGVAVCPMPPGDVAYSRTANSTLGVLTTAPAGETGVDVDAAVNLAATMAELKGRTETVLLAREMLTYTCIQRATGGLGPQEAQVNFGRIATMLENFSAADRSRAAEGATRAVTEATQANVDLARVAAIYGDASDTLNRRVARITSALTTNSALDPAKRDALLTKAGASLAASERQEIAAATSLAELASLLQILSARQLIALEAAL